MKLLFPALDALSKLSALSSYLRRRKMLLHFYMGTKRWKWRGGKQFHVYADFVNVRKRRNMQNFLYMLCHCAAAYSMQTLSGDLKEPLIFAGSAQ